MTPDELEWERENSLKERKIKVNLQLQDAKSLLREAVGFINQVPNGKFSAFPYKDSYELASVIDKFLNELKK